MELTLSTNQNIPTLEMSQMESDNQLLLSQQLLQDNEELKSYIISLNIKKLNLENQLAELKKQLLDSTKGFSVLQQQVGQIEVENQRFTKEYAEVAQQVGRLASLYVTSYRLHQTLNKQEVLQIISEIVSDILGASQLCIFEIGTEGTTLSLVYSSDPEANISQSITVGTGLIGQVALSKKSFLIGQSDDNRKLPEEANLTACIPLKVEGKLLGVVAIFRFFSPREEFSPLDKELFELLSTHAATALYCSGLHS